MQDLEFQIQQVKDILSEAYSRIAEMDFTNEELKWLDGQLDDARADLLARAEEELEGEQLTAAMNNTRRDLANYNRGLL